MTSVKIALERFLGEARMLAASHRVVAARARRPDEEKNFEAYVALLGWWRGEKRLVVITYATNGTVIVAIAPPVPHPFCVSRGADEEVEARAVDEALLEIGARYTSWCRVFYPPGFQPSTLTEAVELLTELELLDEI